jgi:hypothetical protein
MAFEKAEIKKKPVVITDVTIKPFGASLKYVLETNGGHFSFFNKKTDGVTETKAYAQFSKFNFKKGDSVEIAYTEKVSDKINAYTGKPTVYYNVAYFVTADENTPATTGTPYPQSNVSHTMHPEIPTINVEDESRVPKYNSDTETKLADLVSRVQVIEEFLDIKKDGLNISDVPF